MIVLPDVNVLVYAFRRESSLHGRYAAWLTDLLGGADEVGVTESTLTGFLRIVTNPRIYTDPAPASDALAFVDAVRGAPRRRWVGVTDAVWATFSALIESDPQVRGNLAPDAWLVPSPSRTGATSPRRIAASLASMDSTGSIRRALGDCERAACRARVLASRN